MADDEKGVYVRILDKEFRVACSRDKEAALREAAQYLNQQMNHIRRAGRVIGLERIAMMAALNIAHEFLTLKNTPPPPEPEIVFSERLSLLQEKIDRVLAHNPSWQESEENYIDLNTLQEESDKIA